MVGDDFENARAAKALQRLGVGVFASGLGDIESVTDVILHGLGEFDEIPVAGADPFDGFGGDSSHGLGLASSKYAQQAAFRGAHRLDEDIASGSYPRGFARWYFVPGREPMTGRPSTP
jgi:hypothetical protein